MNLEDCLLDTRSAEFRKTVDMGSVQVGHVVIRATLVHHDKWVTLSTTEIDPVVSRGGETASDFLRRRLADPARAARVAAFRKEVGEALTDKRGGRETLAALRMKAGLSQAALAEKMGTKQPNIARWEKSPAGMQFESIAKLAEALSVDVGVLAKVMQSQVSSTKAAAEPREQAHV